MPFASKSKRDRARARVARRVRAGEVCCFCGQPIDLDLKYPDPLSFTVDHLMPTSHGGDDGDDGDDNASRPAHNACNRARSNGPDGTVGTNSGALG